MPFIDSFEFDAPKWQDFSKPSFVSKQQKLIDFLESKYDFDSSFLLENDQHDSSSDLSASWFEYLHPEHELISSLSECNLDSPHLLRKKLGPPVRKLPSESSYEDDGSSPSFSSCDSSKLFSSPILGSCRVTDSITQSPTINGTFGNEEILFSPLFTPLPPKRIRTCIQFSPFSTLSTEIKTFNDAHPLIHSSPVSLTSSKTKFYSPTNPNWLQYSTTSSPSLSLSEHTEASLDSPSFLYDSLFYSKTIKSPPKKAFFDEYIEDEKSEINTAPVSKLLQAFLNKRHHKDSPGSDSELQSQLKMEPNFEIKNEKQIDELKLNNNETILCKTPSKNTLCFATIQQQLISSQLVEKKEKGKEQINPSILNDNNNHNLSSEKQSQQFKNKQTSDPKVIKPPWNPVGIASVHRKPIPKGKNDMSELFSMLAEHNAKIKRPSQAKMAVKHSYK